MINFLTRTATAGAIALACCSAVAGANCRLDHPPLDAGLNMNHGLFLYTYPRDIEPTYSGCQTMWDESGNKILILEFQSGIPNKLTLIQPSTGSTTTCKYEQGKLSGGPADSCWAFDSLKAGFPSVKKGTEPNVPRDRDPRR